jgi:DNA transformation protein and related proteins
MDAASVQDLFASFGPVDVRRMFGGAGVYADGVMFALVVRDVIYLKTDDSTVPAFEGEGSEPFSYATTKGERDRQVVMSYWRLPERLYDEPDELGQWARESLAVALRTAAKSGKAPLRKSAKRRPRDASASRRTSSRT